MPARIAVDAMGGDHAPDVVVAGAVQAARDAAEAFDLVLVGREAEVRACLAEHDTDGLSVHVADAPETIGMDESPAAALKGKPGSSIHKGIGMLKAGAADGFASAGNTGAVMAASTFILGRLPGVLRPALPSFFPTVDGMSITVDVGANVDVRSDFLVQFAQMGRVFAQHALDTADPSVALINVGEEPGKGTEAVKEAYAALQQAGDAGQMRFIGNIEGRDVFHHAADVIVADGFVGNVMLKMGESFSTILPLLVRREVERQGIGAEGVEAIGRVLRGIAEIYNYENYGGVPLLGVDGTVFIGHGGSTARAIASMVAGTADFVRRGVTADIARAISGAPDPAPGAPAPADSPPADA